MMTNSENAAPILVSAWKLFGQLSSVASRRSKAHLRLRRWIAVFGVLATLFAILSEQSPEGTPEIIKWILKLLLIAAPLLASAMAAFTNKFFGSGDWLIARAGAEEVLKEIYVYRTIAAKSKRSKYLEDRLAAIQRDILHDMGGEFVVADYQGNLPPTSRFRPGEPDSDPGFHDLSGEEYVKYRLEKELKWHTAEVVKRQRDRVRLQVLILSSGVIGAILAALGGSFSLWVALAATMTTTFSGWQELRNVEKIIRSYSQVVVDLRILSNRWHNLSDSDRNDKQEIKKIFKLTEAALWNQNMEYIRAMQEGLQKSNLEDEAEPVNTIVENQIKSTEQIKEKTQTTIVTETTKAIVAAEEVITDAVEDAVGELAAEAASDLVQAELASMSSAFQESLENFADSIGLTPALKKIEEEFSGVEIDRNTPRSVVNDLISRFPKTPEVKG